MPANHEERVELLRRWCLDRGLWVGPFDDVAEPTAAALCDRAPETLRYWRGTDRRLPCRKTRAGWRYSLRDLAEFIDDEEDR